LVPLAAEKALRTHSGAKFADREEGELETDPGVNYDLKKALQRRGAAARKLGSAMKA
jgi:hypothetical protein